jgi:Tol biopolymer transport system component
VNRIRRSYHAAGALLAAALTAGIGLAADLEPTEPPLPSEAPAGAEPATAPAIPEPPAIEPLSVRPLTGVGSGRNDSNPVWAPSGTLIAFERSRGERKEIVIARADGGVVHTIYYQLSEDSQQPKFFFPGLSQEASYNAGMAWSPAGDRLVFMSNGGEGNYDLYLRELTGRTTRLTDHKEKDGHAHWSPVAERLVFVSGRTGKGDLYFLNLTTRAVTQLTHGDKPYLYPQWSPDGRRLAVTHGSNQNHDILLMDLQNPGEAPRPLTTWEYDDLRPVWSPDGKKIAFYSNHNAAGDPKVWSIVVIAADGSDPSGGDGLAAKVVATDVLPDVERGPAWLPDSTRLVYVKNDRQEYNPIYFADLARKSNVPIKTGTKMNHDLAVSTQGVLAFRAQVDQWDQIFLAELKE